MIHYACAWFDDLMKTLKLHCILRFLNKRDITVLNLHSYFTTGASVFMGILLRKVPIAVLFGVFRYMGVASLNGIQFWDRILLLVTPVKHHPDTGYVRKVQSLKSTHKDSFGFFLACFPTNIHSSIPTNRSSIRSN